MTPHQATLPQTPVAPRRHRLLATTTFAALLVSAGCVKQPGGASPTERAGLFDNSAWITSGSAAQFTIPGVSWTCIVDIASVNGDDSLYPGNDDQPSYATVSGSVTCGTSGNWAPAYFTQAAVPGEFAAQTAGGGPPVRVKFWRTGNPPQVNVSVATDCAGQCPGSSTGTPSTTPGGGPSSLLSGLGAKWIASPGAAQFQVALSSQGTRECWVYVTAVADSRQGNGGDDYPAEAAVSGEVYCAPYAPVVFNVSVPSDRYAELRPRDLNLNQDGPPVLLTFWSTSPQPLQANISVAADCPNGTCPPAPGTTPAPVTPGLANGGSLSGTDTVFNPAKHWYLCRGGISEDGQATYCPIQGFQCLRSPGSYTDATFLQCAATSSFCEYGEGRTFSECRMSGGRIGWKYCNSSNQWNPCQEPANESGQCAWVFAQLESLWGEYLRDVGSAQAALLQQKSGCTASAAAATPTAPATSATSNYAAGNTSGNTAPPADQSLCTESCGAGRHCVVSLDFSAFKGGNSLSGLKAYHPACRTLAEFRTDSVSKVAATNPNAIGYRQCQPQGLVAWCGLERVLLSPEGGEPRVSTCARVIPGTSLHNGLRRAGHLGRMPECTQ